MSKKQVSEQTTECGSEHCTGQINKGGLSGINRISGPPQETTYTQNTHTHTQKIEIKIPDTAVNRTRTARLEGRDSTDHSTATDYKPTF